MKDPASGRLTLVTTLALLTLWIGEGDDVLRDWYLDHKAMQRAARSGHDAAALPRSLELEIRERLGLGPEPQEEQYLPTEEREFRV